MCWHRPEARPVYVGCDPKPPKIRGSTRFRHVPFPSATVNDIRRCVIATLCLICPCLQTRLQIQVALSACGLRKAFFSFFPLDPQARSSAATFDVMRLCTWTAGITPEHIPSFLDMCRCAMTICSVPVYKRPYPVATGLTVERGAVRGCRLLTTARQWEASGHARKPRGRVGQRIVELFVFKWGPDIVWVWHALAMLQVRDFPEAHLKFFLGSR
jgi:hypothetical protein